jgi:hypothetical protein
MKALCLFYLFNREALFNQRYFAVAVDDYCFCKS